MTNVRSPIAVVLAVLVAACNSDTSSPDFVLGGVPPYAQALFTPEQASDILANGSQMPLSNPLPEYSFNTIKSELDALYPDIDFHYDAAEQTPNLYAFETDGGKVVVVNGGLVRLRGLYYEGLSAAMAYGAACFYGGEPTSAGGLSAVGMADYYAFGAISRSQWAGSYYLDHVVQAIAQWRSMFDMVTPEHAQGNAADPLGDPSLACRLQTIQAAVAGNVLPACAGGPPTP